MRELESSVLPSLRLVAASAPAPSGLEYTCDTKENPETQSVRGSIDGRHVDGLVSRETKIKERAVGSKLRMLAQLDSSQEKTDEMLILSHLDSTNVRHERGNTRITHRREHVEGNQYH